MSILFRKAKAIQSQGTTLCKGNSSMLALCSAERRQEEARHGDFEEAALGLGPLSRPARGTNAKPPGGRPTEHGGARARPAAPYL